MKYILIIILFLSCKAPVIIANVTGYTVNWTTGSENYVLNYQVQRSSNNLSWVTLITMTPKRQATNSYLFALPVSSRYYYYRIYATMKGKGYATTAIYTKTR